MDAGWYQGSVKVVGRDSQRSADLYKQATSDRLPAAIKALEDSLYMLQECTPYLPTKDWKVVKLEEHERHVNQAVLVLNKESVAAIETARGVLNFGLSAIHIKVYMLHFCFVCPKAEPT